MEHQEFALLYSPDYLSPEPGYQKEGDYWENGLLHCGVCHSPRQKLLSIPHLGERKVRCSCQCEAEADRLQRELEGKRAFAIQMERMRTDHISDLSYESCRFEDDDRLDPQTYDICRRYADHWPLMRQNNMGILFYGTVGSGKTYRASCIANAMWEQLVTATVTSFPRLLNLLQDSKDRQGLLDQLNRYELLVIDDLGVERDSAYALEQIYSIVDSRAKSGKPLIVTTNLSLQDLKNPPNQQYARIYDRILELCPITLKMTGDSRRTARAKEKRELARKLLMESEPMVPERYR